MLLEKFNAGRLATPEDANAPKKSLPKKWSKRNYKRVTRNCKVCGDEFRAILSQLKEGRGKGTCCSKSCAASLSAKNRRPQTGENNPNWKGGANEQKTLLYRQRYPEKYRAHRLVKQALRLGLLERKPCAVCGNPKVHGHHDDYSRPYKILWLCAEHHLIHHATMRSLGKERYLWHVTRGQID